MPKSNIENAVNKFSQKGSGDAYEEILYEGSGVAGSAVLIEVLTDNRKRIAPQLRSIFSKHGGALGTSGALAWMFERKGVIMCQGKEYIESATEAAIEAGAEDIEEIETDERLLVYCSVSDLSTVREAVESVVADPEECVESSLDYIATTQVTLDDDESRGTFVTMLEALEDNDDVQNVYHNVENL